MFGPFSPLTCAARATPPDPLPKRGFTEVRRGSLSAPEPVCPVILTFLTDHAFGSATAVPTVVRTPTEGDAAHYALARAGRSLRGGRFARPAAGRHSGRKNAAAGDRHCGLRRAGATSPYLRIAL